MLEINTKHGKVYISEDNIIGLLRNDYYPDKENGYYSIDIQYHRHGMVSLQFKTVSEIESNISFIMSKIKEIRKVDNIDNQDDGYIKGFKEGCEYALKLKDKS